MKSQLKRLTLAAFLLAAALRIVAIPIGMNRSANLSGSFFDEYGGIAQSLVEGRGFSYAWFGELRSTSIHAPVYPFVLSAIFRVSPDYSTRVLLTLILNIVVSLALLLLTFKIGQHFLGGPSALIALVLLGLYPTQIYYSVSGIPTALYAMMLLWVIWASALTCRNPTKLAGVHLGTALGLCSLSYSFIIILTPFLLLWIVSNADSSRRQESAVACMLAVVLAVGICAPWTLRNYAVHGHWILIRDQGGTNLWWGNGPYASGGPIDVLGNRLGSFPAEISEQLRRIPNEVEGDRYLGNEAKQYMSEHPGRTLSLWIHKARLFWWVDDSDNLATGSTLQRLFPLLAGLKAALLFAAAAGVFLNRKNYALISLVALACISIGGIHTVFHAGRLRYFFPLEPLLALPAAAAIWSLLRRHPRFSAMP